MKKFLVLAALAFSATLVQSCASYYSTTTIDPNKTFVLGEGEHPAYKANVKNVGLFDVEVVANSLNGVATPLGTLKPGESSEYSINPNTAVSFKNSALFSTAIKVDIFSMFFPSMGYKDNTPNQPQAK
jgi:ABC-type oligopeptide transport system substrate-binding subunit